MQAPHIDVEESVRQVVRAMGGRVLADSLPKDPGFDNADFVFDQEKVILELKCFEDDNVFSEANQTKARDLWTRWYRKHLVAGPVPNEFDWKKLSHTHQIEFIALHTRSIQGAVRKANRQIRETRAHLGLTGYQGMLMAANNGITSVPPPWVIEGIRLNVQRHHYTEIRHFIFFTANMVVAGSDRRTVHFPWVNFDLHEDGSMNTDLTDRLAAAWRERHRQLLGVPLKDDLPLALGDFFKTAFVPL